MGEEYRQRRNIWGVQRHRGPVFVDRMAWTQGAWGTVLEGSLVGCVLAGDLPRVGCVLAKSESGGFSGGGLWTQRDSTILSRWASQCSRFHVFIVFPSPPPVRVSGSGSGSGSGEGRFCVPPSKGRCPDLASTQRLGLG